MSNKSKQTVKVSVIVPCYNVEKYLPRCLNSLVRQTLKDIEIICINDGSPDNCLEILRDYENKFPSIIKIIDKRNEGVWRGRQDAIALASGEYIGFVDSDDYVDPSFCEELYNAAKNDNSDISVCGFYRVDADTGKRISEEMTDKRDPFLIEEDPNLLLQLNGAPWNKFFRASLLKHMYDFDNPPRIFDDMMMHLLVFPDARSISFTPKPLVYYIIRNDSIMTTIDKTKIDSTYDSMLEVRQHYIHHDASPKMMQFLDTAAFLHLGLSLMFRISYDATANMNEALRNNIAYLDSNFPKWKNPIIKNPKKKDGGVIKRLRLGQTVYKLHLMKPALSLYRFMISKLGLEVKW